MLRIVNGLGRAAGTKASVWLLSAAALAGLGLPSTAAAGTKADVDINIRIGDRHRGDRDEYCERRTRVWVPAQYKTVCDKRWVEPAYEERCERVWCEPVYETRCERVWVPDRYEVREVRRYDGRCGKWVVCRERVLVHAGHWDKRETRVCVREGRWDEVRRRVCVREGRWEKVDRQELVCEGRWEWRTERVRVADRDRHDHRYDRGDRRPIEVVNPHVRF